MRLRVEAPADVAPTTRAAIERKVRLALGVHAAGVERVRITLFGRDERPASGCRIRARLHDGQPLVVEGQAEEPCAAASLAAWRLALRIRRRRAASPEADSVSRRLGLR